MIFGRPRAAFAVSRGHRCHQGAQVVGHSNIEVVVAPHPDDETLGAAACSNAPRPAARRCASATRPRREQTVGTARLRAPAGDRAPERARFGALRQAEARTALAALGLEPACATFLGLPDQGCAASCSPGAGPAHLAPRSDRPRSDRRRWRCRRRSSSTGPLRLAVAVHLALADAATRPRLLAYIVHHPALRGPRCRATFSR